MYTRYKKENAFAVHYVKDGPKLDSTISPEPQYAICSAPVEYDYKSGLYIFDLSQFMHSLLPMYNFLNKLFVLLARC